MLSSATSVHEFFMREAIKQAKLAFDAGEVPVGAVLVANEMIVAKSYNQVELLNDSTAHAEMIALTGAYASLGAKYLPDGVLYVTLEPCLMCAGALRWGKVKTIVFGAYDEKNGASCFCDNKSPYHEKALVIGGVLETECKSLMQDFFKKLR
jgi:tRNA(adenine34) deaminase